MDTIMTYSRSRAFTPLFLSITLAYSGLSYAQTALNVQPLQLDNVTVFLSGAELFNSVELDLPQGESEVLFSNVASGISQQSLLLGASNGVSVMSVTPYQDKRSEREIPQLDAFRLAAEQLDLERSKLNAQLQMLDTQIAMLQGGQIMPVNSMGSTVAETDAMLDLISKRMTAILLEKIEIQQSIKQLDIRVAEQNKQYQEARANWVKGQQAKLAVKFYAPKATKSKIDLSYAIRRAGWQPAYDIKVDKPGGPVNVSYKASVYQNSELDWNNVKLTLSTGNPGQGITAPTLSPRFLQIIEEVSAAGGSVGYGRMAAMELDAPPMPVSSPDVVYAARAKNVSSMDSYVTTDSGGVNANFQIAIPYTIPADAQKYQVNIKEMEIPAEYRYVAIPRDDTDVFLQAKLRDWQGLNLLPGLTTIFFEGSYVGQAQLNPQNVDDELLISLGRDKRIIVKRENNPALHTAPSFFGSDKRQSFAYSITARNTRPEAIKLVVLDQIPVSRDSKISVNDMKYDGAVLDKEKGMLEWTLDLAPGAQRKLDFSYSVKYPNDKQIAGL